VIILEGLLDFRTGVHDEWAVLDDRLANRPALQKEKLRLLVAVLDPDTGVRAEPSHRIERHRSTVNLDCFSLK
jgi:hypothetical protein